MENDDDYESFSFHNRSPSPSPKHRRLKRLKKSTVDLPRVDTLAFDDSSERPSDDTIVERDLKEIDRSLQFDDVSDDVSKVKELSACYDDVADVNVDLKETNEDGLDDDVADVNGDVEETNEDGLGDDVADVKSDVKERNEDGLDDDVADVKETNEDGLDDDVADVSRDVKEKNEDIEMDDDVACVNSDVKETNEGIELDDDVAGEDLRCGGVNSDVKERNEGIELDDDVAGDDLSSGVVRTDRKETKRGLDFDDDEMAGKEGGNGNMDVEIREDDEGVKKGKKKKKKLKSSGDEPKGKPAYSSKRREEKERRAHLDQLHVESQRILRETRGVSFKPVPLVQKPISSILERIRQRKLEMSKKFSQSNTKDSYKEDEEHVIDHSNSVETEASDVSVKEEKVSNVLNGDPASDDVGMGGHDVCGEQKDVNASSPKDLDVESTPALRAPVDDTQELFGDTQTSDGKESEDDESCEQASSSQEEEEEMGPSLLTMKLKFDSAPDDICEEEEEENDKENVDPHDENHSSPRGDPVKAFVDDEAEEEDDSDNDRMVFGDGEENEDEEDDIEELNKMIATGYKERPIDLETRNELHQKWLEEKDAAGTDDLMRRLKLASEHREGSLRDEEEGEEDVEMNDNDDDDDYDDDDDSNHSLKKAKGITRINAKKAKEIIAQMFNDKDDYFSSDEEETEKILAREHLLNKDKVKGRSVSSIEDEDSREVLDLIRKQNTVPEGRKKANATSIFDTMLTGGNSNSSSKSSFLSRMSSHSVPVPSKQGGSSGVRSFIFGRDDSNSRNSISISEDTSDTIMSREVETKKVTTKYKGSQLQGRSSSQTTKLVSESSSSSSSFFEILKQSSVQSKVHDHKVELSQSVFAAFKIPKKPVKIQGRV